MQILNLHYICCTFGTYSLIWDWFIRGHLPAKGQHLLTVKNKRLQQSVQASWDHCWFLEYKMKYVSCSHLQHCTVWSLKSLNVMNICIFDRCIIRIVVVSE
jgi:hypothetical protein